MREIKFRAWNKKEQLMYLSGWESEDWSIYFDGAVIEKQIDNFGGREYEVWRETKDLVLMQYTGLKDKNGVEIYEGDYIVWDSEEGASNRGLVYYNQEDCQFRYKGDSVDYEILNQFSEVIGNIYENPELLKELNDN